MHIIHFIVIAYLSVPFMALAEQTAQSEFINPQDSSTKTATLKVLEKFSEYYEMMDENYLDTILHEKFITTIMKNTINSLDPYSRYYSLEETLERKKTWKGITYSGIGANIKLTKSGFAIDYCKKGYGADSSGLIPGDLFIKVNDSITKGWNLNKLVGELRGTPNTKVKVTVLRGDKELDFHVIRQQLVNPSISFSAFNKNKIGIIKIDQFLSGSGKVFRKEIKQFIDFGARGIIIDLRGNIGGLVKECKTMASAFLPKGSLICALRSKDPKSNYEDNTILEPLSLSIPLVIMIDKKTISAGEIFAGAMQDYDRAVLIGAPSWGKGLVQGTRFLSDGSSLYITAARYYLPSGRCIQEKDYSNKSILRSITNTKHKYYTSNHRPVNSGNGLSPDILLSVNEPDDFIKSVLKTPLPFNFAVDSRLNNDLLDQSQLKSKWHNYLLDHIDEIITQEELSWKAFKNKSSDISFNSQSKVIARKIKKRKKILLTKYKNELFFELQKIITRHIEYKEGEYNLSLSTDITFDKAQKLIESSTEYKALLNITD